MCCVPLIQDSTVWSIQDGNKRDFGLASFLLVVSARVFHSSGVSRVDFRSALWRADRETRGQWTKVRVFFREVSEDPFSFGWCAIFESLRACLVGIRVGSREAHLTSSLRREGPTDELTGFGTTHRWRLCPGI
jgi:hypothetical protein